MRKLEEIVADVERRNDLRREAHLPLLDAAKEIESAQQTDRLQTFSDAVSFYATDLQRMSDEVWSELRAKYGPLWGRSPSARWVVGAVLASRMRQFLADRGHVAPRDTSAIRYGSERR